MTSFIFISFKKAISEVLVFDWLHYVDKITIL
jgi:hypothetical protein